MTGDCDSTCPCSSKVCYSTSLGHSTQATASHRGSTWHLKRRATGNAGEETEGHEGKFLSATAAPGREISSWLGLRWTCKKESFVVVLVGRGVWEVKEQKKGEGEEKKRKKKKKKECR